MGGDESAKNAENAPKFICLNCLPKPEGLGFRLKKASLGVRSPCLKWPATLAQAVAPPFFSSKMLLPVRTFQGTRTRFYLV